MKIFYISIVLLISSIAHAAQQAVTDTGEVVILNDDGTWKYSSEPEKASAKLTTNKQIFKKPRNSYFQLKSSKNDSAFWLDTKKWAFTKETNNKEAEYEFKLKGEDLYAMAITEAIEIDVNSLTDIALSNAKIAAPDVQVIKKEYRIVNNQKVIYMEIQGTLQSIKFTYLGYYYTSPAGSTQLIVYTGTNLVSKYRNEINDMLNGLSTY